MAQNNFTWPLINDNITQNDRESLANFCLKGERFTNGIKVKEFEQIWIILTIFTNKIIKINPIFHFGN